jgi:hypothetical protein
MKLTLLLFVFLFTINVFSQEKKDTIYLMNGHIVTEKVIDTLLGAITIYDTKKDNKKIHYEWDQLYKVSFSNGFQRYYYYQDTTIYNWFTREEMWLFMKGERDARKHFVSWGTRIGAFGSGLIGGMSGTFWTPLLPYTFMAFNGITKVRVRSYAVSDPSLVQYDAYLLGFERVARQKRKVGAVIYGTFGSVTGLGLFLLLHKYYPENLRIQFLKINI